MLRINELVDEVTPEVNPVDLEAVSEAEAMTGDEAVIVLLQELKALREVCWLS